MPRVYSQKNLISTAYLSSDTVAEPQRSCGTDFHTLQVSTPGAVPLPPLGIKCIISKKI